MGDFRKYYEGDVITLYRVIENKISSFEHVVIKDNRVDEKSSIMIDPDFPTNFYPKNNVGVIRFTKPLSSKQLHFKYRFGDRILEHPPLLDYAYLWLDGTEAETKETAITFFNQYKRDAANYLNNKSSNSLKKILRKPAGLKEPVKIECADGFTFNITGQRINNPYIFTDGYNFKKLTISNTRGKKIPSVNLKENCKIPANELSTTFSVKEVESMIKTHGGFKDNVIVVKAFAENGYGQCFVFKNGYPVKGWVGAKEDLEYKWLALDDFSIKALYFNTYEDINNGDVLEIHPDFLYRIPLQKPDMIWKQNDELPPDNADYIGKICETFLVNTDGSCTIKGLKEMKQHHISIMSFDVSDTKDKKRIKEIKSF